MVPIKIALEITFPLTIRIRVQKITKRVIVDVASILLPVTSEPKTRRSPKKGRASFFKR